MFHEILAEYFKQRLEMHFYKNGTELGSRHKIYEDLIFMEQNMNAMI